MTGLESAPVIAFVATMRPAAARTFYEQTLGLRCATDEPFAIVFDAGGTMLRVTKVEMVQPARHTVLGWQVEEIRAAVAELKSRSVSFERFDGLAQDDLDIWVAPGGARIAWFKDPDGNLLSLTEFH